MPRRGETRRLSRAPWFLAGLLPGGAVLAGALLASAIGLSRGWLPTDSMEYLVIAAVFLASAAAGMRCARRRGHGPMTAGIASGGLAALTLCVAALFASGGGASPQMLMRLCVSGFTGGVFGGALSLRSKRGPGKRTGRHRQK